MLTAIAHLWAATSSPPQLVWKRFFLGRMKENNSGAYINTDL